MKKTKLPIPTEYEEALTFVDYLEKRNLLFTHIAQETFTRDWGTRMKNKRMGVRKGFPDYAIIVKNKLIFCELKRIKNSFVSLEQMEWITALRQVEGVQAFICYGAGEAIKFVEQELKT